MFTYCCTRLIRPITLRCIIKCIYISSDVGHTDQTTEESVANDAAEKLLQFDLPAEPSLEEDEASSIEYANFLLVTAVIG